MRPDLRNTASWEALHKMRGQLDHLEPNHIHSPVPCLSRSRSTDNLGQKLEKNTKGRTQQLVKLPPHGSSTKSASAPSFHHQAAAPHQHQLPVSTSRQQDQISISFQLPPPGSSTKSASASSFHHHTAAPNQLPVTTTRQQHHISQPPARQPANQLLTLLPCHTHTMAARSVVV